MASEMGNLGCELDARHWRKLCWTVSEDKHGEKSKMREKNVRIEEEEDGVHIAAMELMMEEWECLRNLGEGFKVKDNEFSSIYVS